MRRGPWLVTAVALGILACGDDSVPPVEPLREVGVLCQLGCTETDPNPTAPGFFLGSGVTPEACTGGLQTDTDQDGLGDFCEENLGAAFAPELYYDQWDDMRREPHWAARPLQQPYVRLVYLLSYYRDAGSPAYACTLPFAHWSCYGHNGDSETISIDVGYNYSTQHWELSLVHYSQHGNMVLYHWPELFYPLRARGYPRAYVSVGKHANYKSVGDCNSGGFFGTDTCETVNTSVRVEAWPWLNIASRSVHTSSQDCMPTSNPSHPYYGSGRQECYWTERRFRGWFPESVGGADSDPYSPLLGNLLF